MKKTLALLMALAMMLACVAGLAMNTSATEQEWVYETYSYQDALEEVGTHGDGEIEIDEATGSYDSVDGFYFCDGLWTYEFWDPETETFEPMTSYYKDKQVGWAHGTWANIYTAFADSAWKKTGYTYCSIMSNGKHMHPGNTAGPAITFIAPASGVISYEASIYPYSKSHNSDNIALGNYATLWVNDTQVYPAPDEDPEIGHIFSDLHSSSSPLEVTCSSFKVNEGDRVRLRIIAAGGDNGGRRVILSKLPTVTYHEASVPIGDPNGTPPANIITERVGKDTTDMKVSWEAAKNAASYNVYVNGEKVNEAPITECTYTVTGLDADTLYDMTVTTVLASGVESAHSDPQSFKTAKGNKADAPATDTSSDDSEIVVSTDTGVVEQPKDEGSFPWWIVAVAGVAVVAIVVVLVLVLGKKKKPAEAAEEAAPAEAAEEAAPAEAAEEAAPAEAAEEAAPAEEEKKDEE